MVRAAALVVLGCLLTGCGEPDAVRPPEILYGADICDRCRMVISEERHAAALERDGREYRFDDPGCLRAFLADAGDGSAVAAWVHDESGVWLDVESAWFVRDAELATPMASGLLAFSSRAAAVGAGRSDGKPLRFSELGDEAASSPE